MSYSFKTEIKCLKFSNFSFHFKIENNSEDTTPHINCLDDGLI